MISGLKIVHSTVADDNFSYAWGERGEVQRNREKFLKSLGLTLEDCVALNLKHTDTVSVVGKSDRGKGMYSLESGDLADAMMTDDREVTLFLLTADCLPVVVFDPDHKAVAVAHVSKINAAKSFLQKVITKMKEVYGSDPASLQVYIGPCIHKENYDFDLVSENIGQLTKAGVREESIEVNRVDTYTAIEYFSHRRSKVSGEPEGRFATAVELQ